MNANSTDIKATGTEAVQRKSAGNSADDYQVVALRYRPQSFSDLVGQTHIATALSNAIDQQRVGHAYLFTGARGVGKTSTARIFAKCLNCEAGPTTEPCNGCDICQTVSVGEDVDVLEIDGASNRGIDEIRQLRSNVGVRPSRARYKIYIIDEVHMLTQPAFNALLKTLEEPPSHVKFIFCTTDAQKIPITVLSRCQRFDFTPVQTDEITDRLRSIAQNEDVEADEEALTLLARRAGGSMRDSQSLLEQLFSFCDGRITESDVHRLLGTAGNSRVAELATAMTDHDSAQSIQLIDAAIADGVDAGQLAMQLLDYFRDMMAARVGCSGDSILYCSSANLTHLTELADKLGLETILAIVQILDSAVVRMQSSLHARTLLEVAAVRVCNLEHLDLLADMVAELTTNADTSGLAAAAERSAPVRVTADQLKKATVSKTAKQSTVASRKETTDLPPKKKESQQEKNSDKKFEDGCFAEKETAGVAGASGRGSMSPNRSDINEDNAESVWRQILNEIGDLTADLALQYEKLELADPDQLVVTMQHSYNRDMCNRPERKRRLEAALQETTGRAIRVDFRSADRDDQPQRAPQPAKTRRQMIMDLQQNPLVQTAIEVFDAEVVDFHRPTGKPR